MPNEQSAATTASQTDPAGEPNLPPVGEYKEAFSAIDDIQGNDIPESGTRQPAREPAETPDKPAKTTGEPAEKASDKAEKPEKPADQPAKRKLGDDLEGVMKPREAPKKADPTAKPSDDPDKAFDAPETPKALRETYRATKENLTKAEARVKEMEAAVEKAKRDGEETVRKEYESRLSQVEKRRSELETELRYADYKRSEEYNEKYHTPLKEAWQETMAAIEGMTITDSEGNEREVTVGDVSHLLQLPNPQARKAANEMFGTAAPEVMQYRAKLLGLVGARDKALDEWKTKGSEREAQIAEARKGMIKAWESEIKEFQTDYPDLFGHKEGDNDGNTLIESGMRLARKAFLAEGVPDGLTPEQRRGEVLNAQTMTALRATAFPRVLRDLNNAKSEIESLKARLKEYQGTEPEPGGDSGRKDGDAGKKDRTPEDEIDALPGGNW